MEIKTSSDGKAWIWNPAKRRVEPLSRSFSRFVPVFLDC
nr:MAG TPA: SMI1-KNR4 cell-wall [Caudoviricetes sp.]